MFNCPLIRSTAAIRFALALLAFVAFASGVSTMGSSISARGEFLMAAAGAFPDALREVVTAGKLVDLRWPDFSDYQAQVKNFYEPTGYSLAWIRENHFTPQALAIIEALRQAEHLFQTLLHRAFTIGL